MAENSKIEWTTHTFNPWIGCTKVGPGCDNCYAEAMMDHRYGRVKWGPHERVRTSEQNWRKPLSWNRNANGTRPRVFCASLADVFDNAANETWRADLFALIHATPNLDWLLLTKRIGNVAKMLPTDWRGGWPNVWLGATVVNQDEADRDIPKLLATPARTRFLSMEPLLGPVNLIPMCPPEFQPWLRADRIGWVIVGGESGTHARTMPEGWALEIRDQCKDAGVAFFMKQGSQANWRRYKEPATWHPELRVREFPHAYE